MAGLGFLGGLGMIAPSIQQGYDAGVERQNREEDRAYQKKQRDYQQGQQQRTLDEQKRDDEYRTGVQGVQTDEQIDDPSFKPAPVTEQPVAQVDIGADGKETVTPAAQPQAAPKIARQRNKDDVLMDYANIARKAGKLDQAFKFEADAEKASHDRAGALFQQWSASTPDASDVVVAANQAKQIYNNDRLPGRVTDVQSDGKGGAVLTMFNKMSGQTMQLPIKNVEDLKTKLEGYYSPETYNAYIKAKREAVLKAQEKGAEPYTLKPGEKRLVGGKEVASNDAPPTGFEDVTDPTSGVTTRRRVDAAARAGKAPEAGKVPEVISQSLKGNEGQIANATKFFYHLQENNAGMDERTAADVAIRASRGTNRATTFNPETGRFETHFKDTPELDKDGKPTGDATGKTFLIAADEYRKGGAVSDAQATAAVNAMKAANPTQFDQYVKAMADGGKSFDASINSAYKTMEGDAKAAFEVARQKEVAAIAANDRNAATAAHQEQVNINEKLKAGYASTQNQARKFELVQSFYKAPPDVAAPAAPGASTKIPPIGGIKGPQVDPNSPAGRSQAIQAQLRAEAAAKETAKANATTAISKQFQVDKASMNPVDLARKYDSARGQLPTADAAELQRIESQAYRAGN